MEMENTRKIEVYADTETKRRIESAAAKRNLPVAGYCLQAIVQQVWEDEALEQEQTPIAATPSKHTLDSDLMAEMRTLRERIHTRRGGELITADVVEQVRAERDEELNEWVADLC